MFRIRYEGILSNDRFCALHFTEKYICLHYKGIDVIRGHYRPSGGRIAQTYSAHSADSVDAASVKNDVTNTQLYDYQIKKAKKIHVKDISRLCVDTFLGEGDDWLHINREKQRVARDITNRWSK